MRRLLPFFLVVGFAGLTYEGAAAPSRDDVPKLLKDLKNKDPKVRARAAEDLGKIGEIRASDAKPAVPTLLEMLKSDKDAAARRAAALALGRVDLPDETVPALIDALKKDKVATVRTAAAQGLGLIGPDAKEAMPALREAAKNREKDRATAQAAQRALRQIRGAN